ncbi:MAG: VanW family protein [Candidatus Daviesbacteria bacterium]|nr:VanW family protein [Candidatus Daviesbacteria bacterium]
MKRKKLLLPIIYILAFFTTLLVGYCAYLAYYQGKNFPGIMVGAFDASGIAPAQTKSALLAEFKKRQDTPLSLSYNSQLFPLELDESQPEIDAEKVALEAYQIGRSGDYLKDLREQVISLISKTKVTPNISFKKEHLLNFQIAYINRTLDTTVVNAKVKLGDPIVVEPSEAGKQIDEEKLKSQIKDYLSLESGPPSAVPLKVIEPSFTTTTANSTKTALEKIFQKPLTLTYQEKSWQIDQKALYSLISFDPKNEDVLEIQTQNGNYYLNKERLDYFILQIGNEIDRPALDAKFQFEPSAGKNARVREFQNSQEGRKLNQNQTTLLLTQNLINDTPDLVLPVEILKPKISNEDVNNLGINELLAQGVSHFQGSITNRIYNLGLAASRINGVLIPPGDNFSFNATVGDISGSSGYKPAYVIKSGRTVLDDGGGVCQVSTTIFRASLKAGLPIVERTAHAYRVGYYEQDSPPGLDATVFHPSVDFKFKNDTGAHILVQTYVKGTSLYVDLYGTPDGRTTSLTTSKVLSQTPPLPELRQDDPTLPKGEIKQVDWAAWGANVVFDRSITKNGETKKETWRSNYRPWQSVYLVGTQ